MIPIDESVSLIGFFGPQLEYLYCLTHSERLSIWNAATVRVSSTADYTALTATRTRTD